MSSPATTERREYRPPSGWVERYLRVGGTRKIEMFHLDEHCTGIAAPTTLIAVPRPGSANRCVFCAKADWS